MHRFTYLFLGLAVLLPVLVILAYRKDLRRPALLAGLAGAIGGPIAEIFYFHDYWRPMTVFGLAKPSIEDALFGFAITCLAITIYPALTHSSFVHNQKPRRRLLVGLLAAAFVCMVLGTFLLRFNSIFVSASLFFLLAIIILVMRRDLIPLAMWSCAAMTVYIFLVYLIMFAVLDPQFWDKYWLLAHTRLDVRLLGIPLTELLWYISQAFIISVMYPFYSGSSAIKLSHVHSK